MKTEIKKLEKLFTAQLSGYEKLLHLSRALIDELDAVHEPQNVTSLMEKRAVAIAGIKDIDSQISEALNSPQRDEWLEQPAVKDFINMVLTSATQVQEVDKELQVKTKNAMQTIQKEVGSMNRSRKSISGYAPLAKPIYAKYVDIKLK